MTEHLEIIYKYFPKDMYPSDLNYIYAPECKLQWKLIENNRNNNQLFLKMCDQVVGQLHCDGFHDMSLQGTFDLSRKAVFYMPNTLKWDIQAVL